MISSKQGIGVASMAAPISGFSISGVAALRLVARFCNDDRACSRIISDPEFRLQVTNVRIPDVTEHNGSLG